MTAIPRKTELIRGVEKRPIVLAAYDPMWPAQFARHAARIKRALADAAIRIEHIGSTAVPGLAAKLIIDILLVVRNSADEAGYGPALEAAGYQLRVREPDWHEHRMFRTPARDVHVHVFSSGCPEIERHLRFRDRLRTNPADRERYEQAKRELARHDWPDMNAYAQAKSSVIAAILNAV